MGLIKMAVGAVGSTFRDQVLDYFRCDGMDESILVMPAVKVMRNGVVNNASENVISNGSVFDVAVGQCAILVENGKVHDFVVGTNDTAGQYKYDSSAEPSILGGGIKDIGGMFSTMMKRFRAGGQSTNTMRLMYVNMLEIHGNKIGIGRVPFMDNRWGVLVQLQGYGTYSYRITHPAVFYEKVCGNFTDTYPRTKLAETMKNELLAALQPALAEINPLCKNGYQDIVAMPVKVGEAVNNVMREEWEERRGITIEAVALASLTVDENSQARIEKMDDARVFGNGNVGVGRMVDAQANAMESAAENQAGAFTGFMGMGMAMNQGGHNANELLMHQQAQQPVTAQNTAVQPEQDGWKCECGKENGKGKFCSECGKPKPVEDKWMCSCGHESKGKFCSECGRKKPEVFNIKCPSCGFEIKDAEKEPKFCPECGTRLN